MWPALWDRLKAVQVEQHKLQIHQNPVPHHPVAHREVVGTAVQSELVTIQHLEADPKQVPPIEEDNEPGILEICYEQGSTEWEVQTDDMWEETQDKENAANDLALFEHFNFLPEDEQQQESSNPDEADSFDLAREIITGFE